MKSGQIIILYTIYIQFQSTHGVANSVWSTVYRTYRQAEWQYSSCLTESVTVKTADSVFVIMKLNICIMQTQKPNLDKRWQRAFSLCLTRTWNICYNSTEEKKWVKKKAKDTKGKYKQYRAAKKEESVKYIQCKFRLLLQMPEQKCCWFSRSFSQLLVDKPMY